MQVGWNVFSAFSLAACGRGGIKCFGIHIAVDCATFKMAELPVEQYNREESDTVPIDTSESEYRGTWYWTKRFGSNTLAGKSSSSLLCVEIKSPIILMRILLKFVVSFSWQAYQ